MANKLLRTKATGAAVNMAQKTKSFDIGEPDNKISLLLLGPAKSGKSTLIKQMQYFSGSSPSTEERRKYTKDIIKSIFVTLQKIIRSMEQLQIGKYINVKNYHHQSCFGLEHLSPTLQNLQIL